MHPSQWGVLRFVFEPSVPWKNALGSLIFETIISFSRPSSSRPFRSCPPHLLLGPSRVHRGTTCTQGPRDDFAKVRPTLWVIPRVFSKGFTKVSQGFTRVHKGSQGPRSSPALPLPQHPAHHDHHVHHERHHHGGDHDDREQDVGRHRACDVSRSPLPRTPRASRASTGSVRRGVSRSPGTRPRRSRASWASTFRRWFVPASGRDR